MCAGQDPALSDLCFTQEWLMDESVWFRSQTLTQNTVLLHGMEQPVTACGCSKFAGSAGSICRLCSLRVCDYKGWSPSPGADAVLHALANRDLTVENTA